LAYHISKYVKSLLATQNLYHTLRNASFLVAFNKKFILAMLNYKQVLYKNN